jgi:hypothetical protein
MMKKIKAEIKDIQKIFKDNKRAFIFGFMIFAFFISFCTINFKYFQDNLIG